MPLYKYYWIYSKAVLTLLDDTDGPVTPLLQVWVKVALCASVNRNCFFIIKLY